MEAEGGGRLESGRPGVFHSVFFLSPVLFALILPGKCPPSPWIWEEEGLPPHTLFALSSKAGPNLSSLSHVLFSFNLAELMFLETSALTGENVEEAFLKCARTILNKIESGTWVDFFSPPDSKQK